MRRLAAAMTLGLLLTSCTVAGHQKRFKNGIERSPHAELADPQGYIEDLRRNEYVVPDAVFVAYADTVSGGTIGIPGATVTGLNGYHGVFLTEYNALTTDARKDAFQANLGNLVNVVTGEPIELGPRDARYTTAVFEQPGNIVIALSSLRADDFEQGLQANRLHEALYDCDLVETAYLTRGANTVLRSNGIHGTSWNHDWRTFYVELFAGNIRPEFEEQLQQQEPEAHLIYTRLVEEARVR